MADQATDKIDATAPAVEAPTASGDNGTTEKVETSKDEAKPQDGETIKEDKVTEGKDSLLRFLAGRRVASACLLLVERLAARSRASPTVPNTNSTRY